jgi:hypothetical protein
MARGVEKRARRVCVPRWVSPVMSLNGMGGPLEWLAAKDPRMIKTLAPEQPGGASASPGPASQPRTPGGEAEEVAGN